MADAKTCEFARAKVNLTLHVTGRRPDGYHLLDSLVVFPELGDHIAAEPATTTQLAIAGPFAQGLDAGPGNLVLKAARLIGGPPVSLTLVKNLPVASGIGGGSSDAAATLRLLSRRHGLDLPDAAASLALGADIPVCLFGRSCRMRGVGEILEPVSLPEFWLVLVNPGVEVMTGAVFQGLASRDNPAMDAIPDPANLDALAGFLTDARNDLEPPAISVQPVIAQVISAIADTTECRLARMSGSGATCFGLYASAQNAADAVKALRARHPGWWVEQGRVA